MNEKDYMKMMYGIREEYIEEAVSWDGAERRRSRSIQHMTMSVGAIAAAIAVTIGVIAYTAKNTNEMLPADSSLAEQQLNILGGHGELTPYLSTAGAAFFRDDDCWYRGTYLTMSEYLLSSPASYQYDKWSVNGGKITGICDDPACTHSEGSGCPVSRYFSSINNGRLMTDGERLYVARANKLYVTDSYGNEELFFEFGDDPADQEFQPDHAFIDRIQALGNGYYMINTRDDEMDPKTEYRIYNSRENSVQLFEYGDDVQPDGKGEGFYYRKKYGEDNLYHCRFDHPNEQEYVFSMPVDALENGAVEWHVVNGSLIYESPYSDLVRTNSVMQGVVADFIGKDPETTFAHTCMGERMYCFCIDRAANTFSVFRTDEAYKLTDNSVIYEKTMDELWGRTLQESDLTFYSNCAVEAGDTLLFMLPVEGRRGEEYVMLNTQTGDVRYAGHTIKDDSAETAPAESGSTDTVGTDTVQQGEDITGTTKLGSDETVQTAVVSGTGITQEPAVENPQLTEEIRRNAGVFTGTVRPIGDFNVLCDDLYIYNIYIGMRYPRSNPENAEHICQNAGCSHNNYNCAEYRLKANNGTNVSDGYNMYAWTDGQVSWLNPETAEYVPFFDFGSTENLDKFSIKSCYNPYSSSYDRYFMIRYEEENRQSVMLFTANGSVQTVASGRSGGGDEPDWTTAQYDQQNRQYIWASSSSGKVIARLDTANGAVTEYPLPEGKGICSVGYATAADWFVANGTVWYNAMDTGWYAYDIATGIGHTVPTGGISVANANVFPCENKLFVIDTQSRMLYACNYDFTDITSADYSSLLTNIAENYGSAGMYISRVGSSYVGYVETPGGDNGNILFTLTADNRLQLSVIRFN